MSDSSEQSHHDILDRIDAIGADFRRVWKTGEAPRIEDYLPQVQERWREQLFRNLLPLDIRYRRRQGDPPDAADYLHRFPAFRRVISDAFQESTSLSLDHERSPVDSPDDLTATISQSRFGQIGDYELVSELGVGGFGVVYEARHLKHGHRVALKMLRSGLDGQGISPERLHKFRREFRTLSEVNHRHLVGMQSLEVDGEHWFFTMDLVDGVDFLSYVRPGDELDEARLRSSLKQLAEGVFALHQRGIVHRDLKPSNVLVDHDGHVTILDFGLVASLSRGADVTVSRTAGFAGTPPYAAPEQSYGERTEASDWYAFGTMVFEALTGERPFRDTDPMRLLQRKQTEDPPRLTGRDELPADLAQLADELIRREAAQRLTPAEIAERLTLFSETRTHGSTESSGSVDEDPRELLPENIDVRLIGRDEQLTQLEQARQRLLETDRPVVAWVSGLSGEGKSALVEHFLRPLRQGDEMLVLSGRCYDRESVPLKALDSQIDPLVRFLRSRATREQQELLPPDIERLAQLFPVLRRVEAIDAICRRPHRQLGDREVRNLGVAALGDLLTKIGERYPLVMFIDDLQWADADSATILAELFLRTRPPKVLLIGSFRSDEQNESHFLSEWHKQFANEVPPETMTITVGSLNRAECLAYVRSRTGSNVSFSDQELAELVESSKGIPYFLEQLVAGFDASSGRFQTVPLATIVSQRLESCPDDATELLQLLAVAGKAIEVSTLAELASNSLHVTPTLAHMQSERLVRSIGDAQMVDTYHDKIRETVLAGLDSAAVRQLHLRFAEHLETKHSRTDEAGRRHVSGEVIFDLARHFSQANDARAFQYHLQAGEKALEIYAMEVAAEHLSEAKRLLPASASDEILFRIHYGLGCALMVRDQLELAIAELLQAVSRTAIRLQIAQCYYLVADAYWRQSEFENAEKFYRQAFAKLGERWPRTSFGWLLATVTSGLAFFLLPNALNARLRKLTGDDRIFLVRMYGRVMWSYSQRQLISHSCFAIRAGLAAKGSRLPEAISEALSGLACEWGLVGLRHQASRFMRRSLKVRQASDGKGDKQSQPCSHDLIYRYIVGQHVGVNQDYRGVRDQLDRTGDYLKTVPDHFSWHSWAVQGNVARLIFHADRESVIARRSGDLVVNAWGMYGLAEGFAKSGKLEVARKYVEDATCTLQKLGAWTVSIAYLQTAKVNLQAGDYGAAENSAGEAVRGYRQFRLFELTAPAVPLLVEAICGQRWFACEGKPSRERARRARFFARFARFLGGRFPNVKPHSFRVSGRRAALQGRSRRALKYFAKAIQAAEQIGANYELARTLIDRSMVTEANAEEDRRRGIELLESQGCVLPDGEVQYLGIDRDAHHDRARIAREREEAKIKAEGL